MKTLPPRSKVTNWLGLTKVEFAHNASFITVILEDRHVEIQKHNKRRYASGAELEELLEMAQEVRKKYRGKVESTHKYRYYNNRYMSQDAKGWE